MHGELKQVADLALFAKIVQTGGISRCAADLGMERTTVSRRLGSLERNLGVKLLDRTPKHIAVTDAGRRCLEQCELLLESARNATSLATLGAIIANTTPIVVGAPPDIIDRFLDVPLREFEDENPGLAIERMPVTIWTDEAIEAVDIGIALAPVTISGGWSNPIGNVRQSVFASADYAERHPAVNTPFDLEMHDCIVESSDRERHSWRFGRGQKVTTVTVKSKYVVSSLLEAREATLAGLGISRIPKYLCEPYLRSGQLVDLTPDVESTGREVVVVSPRQRQRKTGTASLRMHLENTFRQNAA
ncbi:MAG: LysR family transcriptional regulator [Woeseiaceae bacterium]|nr:LysR family transcriptional regulator [Woeseiaceae bacterium]